MPTLRFTTHIHAPIERCFDLSRSVDLHARSTAQTGEEAIGGVTSGLIGLGQEVTWRARHFGVWQTLTSRITACDRPRHFRDSMVHGAFKRFDHDHEFVVDGSGEGTLMTDIFSFDAPLGALGWLAERLFLARYMDWFLRERARVIKAVAESDDWRRYLSCG